MLPGFTNYRTTATTVKPSAVALECPTPSMSSTRSTSPAGTSGSHPTGDVAGTGDADHELAARFGLCGMAAARGRASEEHGGRSHGHRHAQLVGCRVVGIEHDLDVFEPRLTVVVVVRRV